MVDRLVVIGGDAAGMSAAAQARRLRDDLEIVALEMGSYTSYSACGIPYLVAGDVDRVEDLVARTPEAFRRDHRIDVRMHHEAVAVDLDARRVEVRDHGHERTITLPFDHLLFATGAAPIRPDLPGLDADHVHGVQTLDDAAALLERARTSHSQDVVVVGGGYIGLEMAEAFLRRGARVALIEAAPAVLSRTFDLSMGQRVHDALRRLGVDLRLGESVLAVDGPEVVTDAGRYPADIVVLGLGVRPRSELAEAAQVTLGVRGAIEVDRRQRTSAEGVWAAGDCADTWHRVSDRRIHVALGTVANKTGRVAGLNLGGRYATFPGVVGTAITKVCDLECARTGLTSDEAARAGFEAVAVTVETKTRAGYLPDTPSMAVMLVVERGGGRVLGGQIVGGAGAAKRIDTLATAITAGMGVDDVLDLDLAYAPPFSAVWDPVQVAARRARSAV